MPRLLLDPWSPDYEAPIQTAGAETIATGEVDPAVETPDWQAISPSQNVAARRLFFVDGVRRVLSQEDNGTLIHGLFASAGVGSVVTEIEKTLAAAESFRRPKSKCFQPEIVFASVDNVRECPIQLKD